MQVQFLFQNFCLTPKMTRELAEFVQASFFDYGHK